MKDYKKIFETLVNNTEKYLDNYGIKTMVLGISGGLDSTVVAAICHEVAKRDPNKRLIGVSLPSKTNSLGEQDNASVTLSNFCDVPIETNIQETYEAIEKMCTLQGYLSNDVSKGNIKARLRMISLYNIAGVNKGIVMDTDNLTEHYLGFFTIHGDVADLNPIGKLWKTEVYELAKYLLTYYEKSEGKKLALRGAIGILPTDGNGVMNGGDLAQIMPGYTYAEVDRVLKFWIEEMHGFATPSDITTFLYENKDIDEVSFWKVIDRHLHTEYKRKQLPIVLDIE